MIALQSPALNALSSQLQDGFSAQSSRLQQATLRVSTAEQRIGSLQHELRERSHEATQKESAHQDSAAHVASLRARLDMVTRSNQLIADSEKRNTALISETRRDYERQLLRQTQYVHEEWRECQESKHPHFLNDVAQHVLNQEEAFMRLHAALELRDNGEGMQAILDEASEVVRADEELRKLMLPPGTSSPTG